TVTEEGTEAAGATALMLGGGPGPETLDEPFRADRPFIFAIMDKYTGAVLFVGRVLNPVG
ncbi:MAG: serpin family protein, partial [Chloroflexi bacterium]|nr:serpin family protein [Chloroflexota bacterium]